MTTDSSMGSYSLAGRVAVISGASSGVGLAPEDVARWVQFVLPQPGHA